MQPVTSRSTYKFTLTTSHALAYTLKVHFSHFFRPFMKAWCFLNRSFPNLKLVEGQIYEILFDQMPDSPQILVETPEGRVLVNNWDDFHRHWKVDRITDEKAGPKQG